MPKARAVARVLSTAVGSMLVLAPAQRGWGQTPLGTAFTYQGRLTSGGAPQDGTCDFEFRLFDAAAGGGQVGSTSVQNTVPVTAGLFTVSLDFGSGTFASDARWLDIAVRCPAGGGAFTPLAPRQRLAPAPQALFSHAVPDATASTKGGVQIGTGLNVASGVVSVGYGAGAGTATEGNDTRLPPAPAVAGRVIYDTGTSWAALAPGGTNQVLKGGVAPSWGVVNLGTETVGTLPPGRGGTGLTSTGAAGNYLRSAGGGAWASSPIQASDVPGGSGNYIQNQIAASQAASMRIGGTMRLGNETGTTDGPLYPTVSGSTGLVVRRTSSTSNTAGNVVARTTAVRFERDGTNGGFRFAVDPAQTNCGGSCFKIACFAVNSSGTLQGRALALESSDPPIQVFTNADGIVYLQCSFGVLVGDIVSEQTSVQLQRDTAFNNQWRGFLISTTNQ